MKYWVGGTGTWNTTDTTHWSDSDGGAGGAAVPSSADDVRFNSNSGSGIVTCSQSVPCRSINSQGSSVATFVHNASVTISIGDGTAGDGNIALDLSGFTTYTLGNANTSLMTFVSTSATLQTIDPGGKIMGYTQINAAGNWALISNFVQASIGARFHHVFGTLHYDGVTDNAGLVHSFGHYHNINNNTRNIQLGNADITIIYTGTTEWAWGRTGTNATFNAGGSTVRFTGARVKISSSSIFYNLIIAFNGGQVDFGEFAGAGGAANMTLTGNASTANVFKMFTGMTITGALICNGSSPLFRPRIESSAAGTPRTITANGTVSVTNTNFKDITGAGSASWDISAGGNYDISGNSGIIFTAVSAPIVTNTGATGVTNLQATGNGNVTSDGGDATITERGFVLALTADPTTADTKYIIAGTTGAFIGSMTSLIPSTTYHYRAYAINGTGTGYGTDQVFTTNAAGSPASMLLMGV